VWLQQAERIAVSEVAQRLGLQPRKSNSFGPCPNCHALERGSKDKRGTIGLRTDDTGWKCHRCGAGGSGIDLVSYSLAGSKFKSLSNDQKDKVQVWFQGEIADGAPVNTEHKKLRGDRPPKEQVHALWKHSRKLSELDSNDKALHFLKSRNLDLDAVARSGVVRVTPQDRRLDWPSWWPYGRSKVWRIIVPAFDETGQFVSVHGRAIEPVETGPKTLWPKGFEAKGLFMPNRFAVRMIRGQQCELDGVLFVEGLTDFVKCSAEVEDLKLKLAVLGGTSGSFSAISKLNIPKNIKVYVGTDADKQGREYANIIQLQLPGTTTYRIPLEKFAGGSGD
tara:strand:+ start:473 stop:1477 length:1005 start_codon:yes stop_codon:yes gene_type:complete